MATSQMESSTMRSSITLTHLDPGENNNEIKGRRRSINQKRKKEKGKRKKEKEKEKKKKKKKEIERRGRFMDAVVLEVNVPVDWSVN